MKTTRKYLDPHLSLSNATLAGIEKEKVSRLMKSTQQTIKYEFAVIKSSLVELQKIHELLKQEWQPGAPYELSYIDYPLACIKRHIKLVDYYAAEQGAIEQGVDRFSEVISSFSRNAERPFFSNPLR